GRCAFRSSSSTSTSSLCSACSANIVCLLYSIACHCLGDKLLQIGAGVVQLVRHKLHRLPDSHLFRIAWVNTSERPLSRLWEEARVAIAMSIRYLVRINVMF